MQGSAAKVRSSYFLDRCDDASFPNGLDDRQELATTG